MSRTCAGFDSLHLTLAVKAARQTLSARLSQQVKAFIASRRKGKDKDRTTAIYNDNITMENIPLEAYDYVVNGKPALEWVMDRQVVKQDKASGIVNDANDYANETVGDPRYPLDPFPLRDHREP